MVFTICGMLYRISRIVQLRTSTASCNMTRLITPTASIDHLSLLL